MFRVARKIRVGRETGNIHIFFFLALDSMVYIPVKSNVSTNSS